MVKLKDVEDILKEFTKETGEPVELILIGGLALEIYGAENRATMDVDAEVIKGNLYKLYEFFKEKGIPADLTENISGWSVISMPKEYRERAKTVLKDKEFIIKILDPYDFVIAKLRRGTNEDMEDALFVAKKYKLNPERIKEFAKNSIENSVKDTAIFSFKRRIEIFLERLKNEIKDNS